MNVLALTSTAALAMGIGLLLFIVVVGVLYAVLKDRRPRTPIPANLKPYLDDDQLETSHLERVLTYAVWSLIVVAFLMGFYFFTEPGRQAHAYHEFQEQRTEKGAEVYGPTTDANGHAVPGAAGCVGCHGPDLGGGSATYTPTDPRTGAPAKEQVTWIAPPLNTLFLQYSEDQIRTIITYGRPNTPMPAWGVAGGGPLSEQQIADVMLYIESEQLSPDKAKQTSDEKLDVERKSNPDDTEAEALFNANCARCHTIGWSFATPAERALLPPGTGGFGPSLRNGSAKTQFSARQPVTNPQGTQNAFVAKGPGDNYEPVNLLFQYAPKENPSDPDVVASIEVPNTPFVATPPENPNDARLFCGVIASVPRQRCIDGATVFTLTTIAGEGEEGFLAGVTVVDDAGNTEVQQKPALLVPVTEPGGGQVTDSRGRPVSQVVINKGLTDQVTFVTKGSQWQIPYGVRGLGQGRMPGFGQTLTPEQILKIVKYERGL
ncbi:MAG: c-type cytochrome [Acidimicrobiia bacterium]|nr:c-type cytochrome [Acidimicrobiia bacterium]